MSTKSVRILSQRFFIFGLAIGIVVAAAVLAIPLEKNIEVSELSAIQKSFPPDALFLISVNYDKDPHFIMVDGPLDPGEEVLVSSLAVPVSHRRFIARRAPFLILVHGELEDEIPRMIDCREWWMVAPEIPIRVLDFVLYPDLVFFRPKQN